MILISAGLVLAAVVLLIAGFVLAKPFLIMWSIVVSVLSALFLVIGAFLRRHELFPGGGRAAARATPPAGLMPPGLPYDQTAPVAHQPPPRPRPQPQQRTATVPAPAPRRPAAGGVPPDAIVLVIPGRKRYHVAGCRQLAGRDHEELTYEEAREEGFTPCTACLPDAALGGRQLPPAADPEPAAAPGSAFAAESRAETSAETRDVRPPVAPPKPDTKASTPSPEPAAAHEEGAAGWFGRPAAAQTGQAKTPSSAPDVPGSEDEQSETQTSYFRPPPYALRSESAPSGAPGRPPAGEPSRGPGRTPPPGKTPEPGGKTTTPAGEPSSRPGEESRGPAAAGEGPAPAFSPFSSPSADPSARRPSGQASAGKAEAPQAPQEGVTEPALRRPGQSRPPAAKTGRPAGTTEGGKAEGPAAKTDGPAGEAEGPTGRAEAPGKSRNPGPVAGKPEEPGRPGPAGRPGQSEDADLDDDDSSGPATAPQPRVPASAAPPRSGGPGAGGPGSSGGSAVPSQRLSGASKTFSSVEPAEEVVPERPASSAESQAKPKGPLPSGPGAAARPAQEGPSGSGPGTPGTGAKQPVAPGTGPKAESPGAGSKGEAPGAGSKGEAPRTGAGKGDEPSGAKGDAPGSKGDRSGTVKVIVGTRRYHSTACPLIKGAGDSGVETMTVAAAEAAGLTSCSVCQHDRETVS